MQRPTTWPRWPPRDPNGCLDAIARLLTDPERLRRMSAAALRLRGELRPDAIAELMVKLAREREEGHHAA